MFLEQSSKIHHQTPLFFFVLEHALCCAFHVAAQMFFEQRGPAWPRCIKFGTSEPFTLYLHPDGFLTLSFSIAIHNICLFFFFNCLPLSTRVISIRTRALSGSFIAISLRTESSSEKELNKYLLIEQVNESRFSIYCNLGKLHKSSMFQFLYLPSRKIENLTCGLYFRLNDSVSYYFSI